MTAMEEGLDIDKIMLGLGFSKECDGFGDGYDKEVFLCSSNCIGCEYKISFRVRMCKDGMCDAIGIMYKPLVRDREIRIGKHHSMSDQPPSKIFLLSTERDDIENAVYDCANAILQVMTAMDFRQLSGMDFINLADCPREEIMNEFEKQTYMNIYVPFNPHLVPGG